MGSCICRELPRTIYLGVDICCKMLNADHEAQRMLSYNNRLSRLQMLGNGRLAHNPYFIETEPLFNGAVTVSWIWKG